METMARVAVPPLLTKPAATSMSVRRSSGAETSLESSRA